MITYRIKLGSVSFAIVWAAEIALAALAHYALSMELLAALALISAIAAILIAIIAPQEEPHA